MDTPIYTYIHIYIPWKRETESGEKGRGYRGERVG